MAFVFSFSPPKSKKSAGPPKRLLQQQTQEPEEAPQRKESNPKLHHKEVLSFGSEPALAPQTSLPQTNHFIHTDEDDDMQITESSMLRQNVNVQMDLIQKLENDNQDMHIKIKRLQDDLFIKEREHAIAQEKARSIQSEFNQSKIIWEKEKQELQKEILTLKHRDTQYLHEIRKKERELEKTQKKIQSMVGDKTNRDLNTKAITLPFPVTPTTRNVSEAEDVYRNLIRTFEEKERILFSENENLRNSFHTLNQEIKQLQDLISGQEGKSGNLGVEEENATIDDIEELLQSKLDSAQPIIEDRIKSKIDRLRKRITNLQGKSELQDNDAAALQQQLRDYKKIIEEQDKLLEFSLKSQPVMSPFKQWDDSRIEEEKRMIAQQKELLESQRNNLMQERNQLMDQAMKIHTDRVAQDRLDASAKKDKKTWEKSPTVLPDFFSPIIKKDLKELSSDDLSTKLEATTTKLPTSPFKSDVLAKKFNFENHALAKYLKQEDSKENLAINNNWDAFLATLSPISKSSP